MSMRDLVLVVFFTLVAGSATAAPSFGLGSLKDRIEGDADQEDVEEDAISDDAPVGMEALLMQADGLMGRFALAYGNMNASLKHTLLALGLEEDAAAVGAIGEFYLAGNVADEDQIERDIEVTARAQERAREALDAAAEVSDEGRAHIASAVPHYAKAIYEVSQLKDGFTEWSSTYADGVAQNPLKAMKAKSEAAAPLLVARNLPGLVTSFARTTGNFIKLARRTGVEIPSDLTTVAGF